MALPTTIVSKSHWAGHIPPITSSGGDQYTVAKRSATDDAIRVYKATDPESSWSEQTTSPIVTEASVVSAVQSGNVIHIASYDAGTYEYHQFNMSTDAYDVKDELIETPTNAPTFPWISIAVRSDGDVVVVYAGDTDQVMGGKKERIDGNVRTSGTWGGPVVLSTNDTADEHYGNPNCVKASDSDDIHIMWEFTGNAADPPTSWGASQARTLDSGDSLSTVDQTTADVADALLGIQNGVSFDDGGTQVTRFVSSNDLGVGSTFMLSDTGTGGVRVEFETFDLSQYASSIDFGVKENGEAAICTIAGPDSNGDIHVLWSNEDDTDDIYYATATDTGDTWSAEAQELDAVACNFISANIYVRDGSTVLAYVYDDGGTTKYNEKVIIAGGTEIAATTDALVLAEQAATVNAETSITTNAPDALVLAEQTATVALAINVEAGVDALTLATFAATVNAETSITTSVDALTLAEQTATVNAEISITTNVDALVIAEQAADVNLDRFVSATVDALALVTFVATVSVSSGDVEVLANVDALVLAEQAATVNAETNIAANVDALVVATFAATVNVGIGIITNVDALALTEQTATVNAALNLTTNTPDALVLAEQSATVNAETNVNTNVDALAIATFAADVDLDKLVNVGVDALVLAEQAAVVNAETSITTNAPDALAIATFAATITLPHSVAAGVDALVIATPAADVNLDRFVSTTTDALVTATFAAVITTTTDIEVLATTDALILTENVATVNAEISITAGVDALVLTENAATVNAETSVDATSVAMTLATFAAGIKFDKLVTATTVAMTVATHTASVNLAINVQAGVDSLVLTEYASTVNAETNVQATTNALVLVEFAAGISIVTIYKAVGEGQVWAANLRTHNFTVAERSTKFASQFRAKAWSAK